jgi:hypothetical protein
MFRIRANPEHSCRVGSRSSRVMGGDDRVNAAYPDDYVVFGDVYETLDACQQIDLLLSRLRRQSLLDDQDWIATRAHIAEVRKSLETMLEHRE